MVQFSLDWSLMVRWTGLCAFAGTLSFVACAAARRVAEKSGRVTQPGHRQSHRVATPTGGGLGLVFSIVVSCLGLQQTVLLPAFYWRGVLPGVLLLALVGWQDDRASIDPLIRLSVQFAAGAWLLLSSGGAPASAADAGLFAAALVAMVWLMNLYNFMDGSDGMAGFQGLFAGVVMAVLFQAGGRPEAALLALAVAAACAGFLPLNFPRARVFMGDVASVPLGFMLASLAVYGVQTGSLSLPVFMLIMALFLVDATLTLLTRVIRGERWYTAHAEHVYQRLIAHGWSHRRVLLAYQAINVAFVLPAIILAESHPRYAVGTAGFTLLALGACWRTVNRRLGVLTKVQLK